jgi:hypothetical protein
MKSIRQNDLKKAKATYFIIGAKACKKAGIL